MGDAALNAQAQVELQRIPIFYGDTKKDIFTADQFIDRLDRAAVAIPAHPWAPARKITAFINALRGDALTWFEAAREHVDAADYDQVVDAFKQAFSPTQTTRTTIAILHDLMQKKNEGVVHFYSRVTKAIRDIKRLEPDCPEIENPFPVAITALDGYDAAVPAAARTVIVNRIQAHASRYSNQMVGKHIFIAGLHPKLRDKLMESGVVGGLYEAFLQAQSLEKIQVDPDHTKVAAIDRDDDDIDAQVNSLNAQIEALNRRRGFRGGSGYRGRGRGGRGTSRGRGGSASASRTDKSCYHCGRKGHFIADCQSKKRGEPRVAPVSAAPVEEDQGISHPFQNPQSLYEQEEVEMSAVSADYLN